MRGLLLALAACGGTSHVAPATDLPPLAEHAPVDAAPMPEDTDLADGLAHFDQVAARDRMRVIDTYASAVSAEPTKFDLTTSGGAEFLAVCLADNPALAARLEASGFAAVAFEDGGVIGALTAQIISFTGETADPHPDLVVTTSAPAHVTCRLYGP